MPLPFLAHLRGRLDECILLTYRTPADSIRPLLPKGLEPVTHHARGTAWAFWNIAMCSIEQLRPSPVPRALGMACRVVAYRLLVRAGDVGGLYFCRSDIDHSLIARSTALSGELASYPRPCQIFIATPGRRVQFIVRTADRLGDAEVVVGPPPSPDDDDDVHRRPAVKVPNLHLVGTDHDVPSPGEQVPVPGQCDDHNVCIPAGDRTIFSSIDEARKVLGTPAVTFAPAAPKKLKVVKTHRDDAAWDERPIVVHSARFGYLATLNQTELSLELAARVAPIDCQWRLGETAKVG